MLYFPSHAITIRRLRSIGGGKSNFSATFTVYAADIQPAGLDRENQIAPGRVGAVYEAFVDSGVQVREGDQIDSGGVRYSVRAVTSWQGAGMLDHKHLILVSQDGS